MGNDKKYILGVGISDLDRDSIEKRLEGALAGKERLMVMTPNSEIILAAQDDEEFHYALNQAHLAVADSMGISICARMAGFKPARWPGSDMTLWLLERAQQEGLRVSIVCLRGGLSSESELSAALKSRYPRLDFMLLSTDKEWTLPIYEELNRYRPDIVFVALGFPYQEKFITKNFAKMEYARIMIGVGGSFDYVTGKVKETPRLFRNMGIEWFWRLLHIFDFDRPLARFKRIMNALFVFPLVFLKWQFLNPHIYRKNVICLLYKKDGQQYSILLLRRAGDTDHWQLPQGGTDGLSLAQAGAKELQEELSTYKFKVLFEKPDIYRYRFPADSGELVPFKFRNYKGQSQGMIIAEYYGQGEEISVNYWEHDGFDWFPLEKVLDKVKPIRREVSEKVLRVFKEYIEKN